MLRRDSFSYTVSDGTTTSSATVSITVTEVNDPPTTLPYSNSTNEDVTLVVPPIA